MAKRIYTLAVALLLFGVFITPAAAEDYRDAEKNFKNVFKNPESTSYQKADAIKRLANSASDPRDAKKALKEFFNLLKDKNLLNDRQIQGYEQERDKIQAEHEQIVERARANGNRAPQSDIDRMKQIEARIAALNDLISSNNIAKNAVVDSMARMSDPESKAEIIENITNRDADVASACIDCARKGRWRDAWDNIVSAFDSSKDAGVRILAVTALRKIDANRAIPVLTRAINDEHYLVRTQAVMGLRETRSAAAVEALIERLDQEPAGRLKWDIVYALQDITGKTEYGAESTTWRGWWSRNKGNFQPAAPSNPGQGSLEDGGGGASDNLQDGHKTGAFYGIPIRTKHPVFVVDRSGSMLVSADPNDPQQDGSGQPVLPPPGKKSRWQVCQDELIQAVKGLPDDATFAVVHFSTNAEKYANGEVFEANERNKQRLEQTIRPLAADGLTNIHEAFQFAFEICTGGKLDGVRPVVTGRKDNKLAADTIFFLTDGSPTVGQSINGVAPTNPPNQQYSPLLLEEICRWNETRGIVIHTVCIGEGDVQFLSELAKRNRGTFRKVTKGN